MGSEQYEPVMVALRKQLEIAMDLTESGSVVDMSEDEKARFAREHPGAHFVVGDFEIKCLCPEKYHLT